MRRYQLPVVKNLCPVDGATKREAAKQMLAHMEEEFPKAKAGCSQQSSAIILMAGKIMPASMEI